MARWQVQREGQSHEHGGVLRHASAAPKSDLRNHQAIVQPRLYDSLMVTQITLPDSEHGKALEVAKALQLRRRVA